MEHQEIERNQIVERYLADRLSAGDEERFEEHYLSCQECLDELELSAAFRDGIRVVATEEALTTVVVRRLGVAAWLKRAPRAGLLAAASLVAVALPLALFVIQRGELRKSNAELAKALAPQQDTLILALSPERGGHDEAPAARVRLPHTPGWIVLALELDRPEFETYSVTLRNVEGKILWSGEGLSPNHLDALTVSLHSSFLGKGDYELEAEGLQGGGPPTPAGRFAFRALLSE